MENTERINELQDRIRALQEEIKTLKNDGNYYVNGAKLVKHNAVSWAISVSAQHVVSGFKQQKRYAMVASCRTREETIDQLNDVINSLTELRRKINDVG